MKFASMKVSRQLALGFGAVLALLTALLAVGISRMGQINDGLDMVINNRMPKLEKMYEISVRMMDNARIMRGLIKERVDVAAPRTILDVCCGSGNLSLPLAAPGRLVEGVEANRHAIDVAKHNVAANGKSGLHYLAGDAERHLWKCDRDGERFDLVLLDPPRQGMHGGMMPLKNMGPETIIYVGCDPTTLARDLNYLLKNDAYRLDEAIALDFFPNTYHVETLAILKKNR